MKAKRHEALAAVLLSGAVIFAGASFAAGAGDLSAPAPGSTLSNSPSIPGPADANAQLNGAPGAGLDAAKDSLAPPSADIPPPPAPPATERNAGPESAAPVGEPSTQFAELGKRSADTSRMSRRKAEQTEKKITQDLNRAAAAGIARP